MKKDGSLEEGSVSELDASSSSSPAHVLVPLGGMKSVFINVIFQMAALYKTTGEQFGHIFFFFFKATGMGKFPAETPGGPLTVHSSW